MKTYRKDREGLDAVRIPSDAEIMWAAGIYEGEGSCVRSGNRKVSFNISVSQKDPELLYRLRDMFGGSVKEYSNDRGTNIKSGPLTVHAWRLAGDRARLFIGAVYPYLTARRKAQIDNTAAREFLDFTVTLPTVDTSTFSVHSELTAIIGEYVQAHREFAKEKRRQYMQRYDQREEPKARRREYMRQLRRKKQEIDTNDKIPNILKFG